MNHAIRWLRLSYWLGAILDARAAVGLTQIFLASLTAPPSAALEFRPEAGTAAALMWGWTVLLLWADRKPLERKGVLLLTLVPVILLLAISTAIAQVLHLDPSFDTAQIVAVSAAVIVFAYSYWNARRAESAGLPPEFRTRE